MIPLENSYRNGGGGRRLMEIFQIGFSGDSNRKVEAAHLPEMVGESPPVSESEGDPGISSSEESNGGDGDGSGKLVTEYEKQRISRIQGNMARMEALGLRNLSSPLSGSAGAKGKRKVMVKKEKGGRERGDEDEEYRPNEGDGDDLSSSGEDGGEDAQECRGGSGRKGRRKSFKNSKTPKMKPSSQILNCSDGNDDEEDVLQQAIALSLEDNVKDLGGTLCGNSYSPGNTGRKNIPESTGRTKKRKMIEKISRMQMTEDEMVAYFFSLDEAGKGSITIRDLRKMAAAHDFTWTDKELADMISCFDPDGDGKLRLEDFRTVVSKCNMLRDP